MPTFTPKTEAEAKASGGANNVFPAGTYDFEIKASKEKTSKAGNPMIELRLRVFNDNGDETTVWDYLLFDDKSAYKLRHCCSAIGIMHKYDTGDLDEGDFESGMGKLKLKVQPAKDGYPEKNTVSDYVQGNEDAGNEVKKALDKAKGAADLDDSIPF